MKKTQVVTVNDLMQTDYTYTLEAPMGKQFAPEFRPDLTPKEMLAMGIFGGVYMRDCMHEFPKDWFTGAILAPKTTHKGDKNLNYFKVRASQSINIWRNKGWINQTHDPRGWFQWYCRYYMGRRLPKEDARQIKRWKAISRHVAQVRKNCRPGDIFCRPRQRQALLHWGYDSRRL